MFNLFKPKPAPDGPVVFEFDIEIERPAGDVYAMLDFADARCWKKETGRVERTGETTFDMVLDFLPDITFHLDVHKQEPGTLYAFDTSSDEKIGRLVSSSESYEIEALADDRCRVTLVCVAQFDPGMTKRDWEQEVQMMAGGVNIALGKLKVHAEEGVEAIREIEAMQMAEPITR